MAFNRCRGARVLYDGWPLQEAAGALAWKSYVRILILTQYFPPEIGGPQTRLAAMAAELRRLGHDVEVVTGLPNYPRGKLFPGYRNAFYRRGVRDGVTVHRVWLYPAMGGGIKRMFNYISFAATSIYGLMRAEKPDYIFVESPPLFLAISACIAGRLRGAPFIFSVADLWPDAIAEGGFLPDGVLLRCLAAIEKWSYRKAAYVNAVTEGIRDALLLKKSVAPEKVLFLPNGVDTIRYQPRAEDAALKKALGLDGKRVILWAGTLGYAHDLENTLLAAQLLSDQAEIHFLFVGDGSAKASLQELAGKLRLSNVTFCEPVPLEQLPPYLSIADCGLASLLNIPIHEGARPSKIFPILASGKPLIFVGKGEGARLVQQAGAGVVVAPGDPAALAQAVLQLTGEPESARALGMRGREFVEENLQWSKLISAWLDQVKMPPALPRVSADFKNA
jgi:putative colanic acid biosynthesis glycosyltransferase WcaI